jgi:hypothetical protein
MTIEDILVHYPEHLFYTPEGFDDAVVGIEEEQMRLVYSVSKCIEILKRNGMDDIDAIEHFELNVRLTNPPHGAIFIQTDFTI